MFKNLLFFSVLTVLLVGTASAESYWVNIVDGGSSMSLPVDSNEQCTETVYRYVQSQLADAISCDVQPLPDAVNLKTYSK